MTTEENRIKLVSEPNYDTTKKISENLLAIEMKNVKVRMNKPEYLGMSILDISLCMNFGMIMSSQSTKIKQNYATQTLIALLYIFLLKTFLRILIMMLKDDLIHLIMITITKDHFKQT